MTPEEKTAHEAEYKKRAEAFAKLKPDDPNLAKEEEALARFLQEPWVAGNAHEKPSSDKKAQAT